MRSSVPPALLLLALASSACTAPPAPSSRQPTAPTLLRVTTFNVEDVRTTDLEDPDQPRLRALAAVIQQLHPDILFLAEIAYDQPGAPGYRPEEGEGRNAQRFADQFLAVSQGPGLEPLHYHAFMAPSNTGLPSGFDLDNDGRAVTDFPAPPMAGPDGAVPPQTDAGRAYGNDCWGFGTFPGQYAMGLLVRDGLTVDTSGVRTFQRFRWGAMPEALAPVDPATGEPWYAPDEWAAMRLSSKSHWDIPVLLPDGHRLHLLCSHPTPPHFDGPEGRNHLRNHDEIRFWSDYLDDASYLVDDQGIAGGLPADEDFVIVGDLNADPDEGDAYEDPIGHYLLANGRIASTLVPRADAAGIAAYGDLDPDDTSAWGYRIDYVLPARRLEVVDGGIFRYAGAERGVSDHFPVWLDLRVPSPESTPAAVP